MPRRSRWRRESLWQFRHRNRKALPINVWARSTHFQYDTSPLIGPPIFSIYFTCPPPQPPPSPHPRPSFSVHAAGKRKRNNRRTNLLRTPKQMKMYSPCRGGGEAACGGVTSVWRLNNRPAGAQSPKCNSHEGYVYFELSFFDVSYFLKKWLSMNAFRSFG